MPISDQLRRILLDARRRYPTSPYVVTYRRNARGRYAPIGDIRGGLHAAMQQAAVPYGRDAGATFHTLRHTAATLLVELEVPPEKRQGAMGHEHLSTTTWYEHLRPTAERPVLERLSEAMPMADLVTTPWTRASRKGVSARGENGGSSPRRLSKEPVNTASHQEVSRDHQQTVS